MFIQALATDYDGTIAEGGTVLEATDLALQAFKKTGRKLILVTGRELPELKTVYSNLKMFDRVVAENGALLYDPASEEERLVSPPPSEELIALLKSRGVGPISAGGSIIATWEPHQNAVLEAIHELGLELQIIFNKGAVMILPAGINKATGLAAALKELKLSSHNVVAVGDAENDHAFFRACGFSAAVANALPMLKETASIALKGERGAGVVELVGMIGEKDGLLLDRVRHGIPVGTNQAGDTMYIEPYLGSVLLAGSSGIGKSTLATALTEHMAARRYEFCVFDPEGDYLDLENSVPMGDAKNPPRSSELTKLFDEGVNVVVNTQALVLEERPVFFAKLLPQISDRRAKTGRPHWLIIDEVHHLLPVSRHGAADFLPQQLPAAVMITVHPEVVSPDALKSVTHVIALGKADEAFKVISAYCAAAGMQLPDLPGPQAEDEVLFWRCSPHEPVHVLKPEKPRQTHKRHTKKYAEGDLGPDRSFYFTGPKGALKLRAQNLMLFLQIAEGIDEDTWQFHRKTNDYSKWFRRYIKDNDLADEAAAVEADKSLDAKQSRARVAEMVSRRYTAPANAKEPA